MSINISSEKNPGSGINSKSESTKRKENEIDRTSDVWNYMKKQGNDKATCNICGITLCRKNGNTTGLRKHLNQVHRLAGLPNSSCRKRRKSNHLEMETKKILDSLLINCIIEDGRSFSDMCRPGVLRIFNHFVPGEQRN